MDKIFHDIFGFVQAHDAWMENTINLVASGNRLSSYVERCLLSDMGRRVAEGDIGKRMFPGLAFYDSIETYGIALAKEIFHADFADLRPISGTIANMAIYAAFTSHGDTIMALSIPSGSHVSMAGATPRKIFKLHVVNFPVIPDVLEIDVDQAISLIRQVKPRLILLGGSVLLFRQPVAALSAVARETGAVAVFDASHVAGLIAGRCFPNPLDEGADIMTMTTSKTIPGPQHAFILAKKDFGSKIKQVLFPGLLSSHHLHETVASILALEEMRVFGREYAQQIVRNSQALARALSIHGFDILAKRKGFTETHQVLVNISRIETAEGAERLLEAGNILVNKNVLPGDQSLRSPSGLRLGTQELTRMGMKEADMAEVARFVAEILIEKSDPEKIKEEVTGFRRSFTKLHYCFQ